MFFHAAKKMLIDVSISIFFVYEKFSILGKVLIGQDLGQDVARAENIGAGRIFSPQVKCWCLRRDASSSFLEFGGISLRRNNWHTALFQNFRNISYQLFCTADAVEDIAV